MDPALEPNVTDIQRAMQRGSIDALESGRPRTTLPGILLGRNLAEQLGVDVGDTATLLTPQGTLSPMGMIPRTRRVRVAGIYALGLYEFDAAYGFVSLEFAERLLGQGRARSDRAAGGRHRRRSADFGRSGSASSAATTSARTGPT